MTTKQKIVKIINDLISKQENLDFSRKQLSDKIYHNLSEAGYIAGGREFWLYNLHEDSKTLHNVSYKPIESDGKYFKVTHVREVSPVEEPSVRENRTFEPLNPSEPVIRNNLTTEPTFHEKLESIKRTMPKKEWDNWTLTSTCGEVKYVEYAPKQMVDELARIVSDLINEVEKLKQTDGGGE